MVTAEREDGWGGGGAIARGPRDTRYAGDGDREEGRRSARDSGERKLDTSPIKSKRESAREGQQVVVCAVCLLAVSPHHFHD